jgi:hypothetical protein
MTLASILLLALHLPGTVSGSSYEFTTEKYAVEMRVSVSAPYEGERLVLYSDGDPGKDVCPPIAASSRCIENFVGALAAVEFKVTRVVDGKPASTSIREIVTVVDQSPGLPERPPYAMSVPLINGIGSDLQAFGYDEGPLPASGRAAEREAARTAWRRYRQELYLDADRQPFAVIEWHHTISRICILRVDRAPGLGRNAALCGVVPTHLLPNDAPEGLFPLWEFPLDVFTQGRIDQRLVADLAARPIGDRAEIIDQVFVQPDGDSHLSGF